MINITSFTMRTLYRILNRQAPTTTLHCLWTRQENSILSLN